MKKDILELTLQSLTHGQAFAIKERYSKKFIEACEEKDTIESKLVSIIKTHFNKVGINENSFMSLNSLMFEVLNSFDKSKTLPFKALFSGVQLEKALVYLMNTQEFNGVSLLLDYSRNKSLKVVAVKKQPIAQLEAGKKSDKTDKEKLQAYLAKISGSTWLRASEQKALTALIEALKVEQEPQADKQKADGFLKLESQAEKRLLELKRQIAEAELELKKRS